MRKCFFYKLEFKSPLHLGIREEFLESTEIYIPSDTFFSAFCNAYLLLYGEMKLENLLNKFQNDESPFLISSCFLWRKGQFFFPVPLNQFPKDKKYKKIKFVPKDIFEELLAGKRVEECKVDENNLFKKNILPRVRVSRMNKKTEYFHFSEIVFEKDSGLYFLIDFKDTPFKKEFEATLNLLGDEGIGGDRTVGKGFFRVVEKGEIEFKEVENADGFVYISLIYPRKEEVKFLQEGFYEIVSREGYIFSPFTKSIRKKGVRMLKEGTVTKNEIRGKVVDITPKMFKQHKVYRYGISFSLPCKLEKNK